MLLPEITTARLRLRALGIDDAAELRRLSDDPAILAAVDILPEHFTEDHARTLVRRAAQGREVFLGGRLVDGRLAVVCGVHLDEDHEIEIGYWVGVAHQRLGLAFEAVSAVLASLRASYPDRRLFAECRPENVASWRLLSKLGFRPSGEAGRRPGRSRLVL